jgi:sec-independent protein translocase protein TatA
MGFGTTELIIILVIVLLLFGGKRLRNIGSDLGSAIKGFKKSMDEGQQATPVSDDSQIKEPLEHNKAEVINQTEKENKVNV